MLAQALANGLAKVGTAAGAQLLVNEVLRSVQTVEGLADIKDLQAQAAFTSLDKVRNSNAVEGLATGLLNADSSEIQRYVSGMTLAAMGKWVQPKSCCDGRRPLLTGRRFGPSDGLAIKGYSLLRASGSRTESIEPDEFQQRRYQERGCSGLGNRER